MPSPLPRLRAGDMREKIGVVRQTGNGWTVVATPWAEVQGQDGREAVIGQALQGVSVIRIRIRWRADLLPSDQVRRGGPGGTDLNITSISDPNGEREQLMILATTGSALSTS